jgi:hypothetical protein
MAAKKTRTRSRGLGDTVEKIIKATGLDVFVEGKDCGCDARKEKLNKLFPYRTKQRCFTEEEYNAWGEFTKNKKITITSDQVKYVCELYASVFFRPVWYPCSGCSPKPLINMIDKLDVLYNSYETK